MLWISISFYLGLPCAASPAATWSLSIRPTQEIHQRLWWVPPIKCSKYVETLPWRSWWGELINKFGIRKRLEHCYSKNTHTSWDPTYLVNPNRIVFDDLRIWNKHGVRFKYSLHWCVHSVCWYIFQGPTMSTCSILYWKSSANASQTINSIEKLSISSRFHGVFVLLHYMPPLGCFNKGTVSTQFAVRVEHAGMKYNQKNSWSIYIYAGIIIDFHTALIYFKYTAECMWWKVT